MKTIPVDQLDERLAKALEQQNEHEPIRLTKGAGTVAWVLRVPEALKNSEADLLFLAEGPTGPVFVIVQAKSSLLRKSEAIAAAHTPVFGAGRGTLTVVSEDDDHLKDFQEYME